MPLSTLLLCSSVAEVPSPKAARKGPAEWSDTRPAAMVAPRARPLSLTLEEQNFHCFGSAQFFGNSPRPTSALDYGRLTGLGIIWLFLSSNPF